MVELLYFKNMKINEKVCAMSEAFKSYAIKYD